MAGPHRPDWDFLYSVARSELDTQLTFIDGVDTKLGIVFSAGSAEAAIVAAAFAVVSTAASTTGHHSAWPVVVLVVSILGYIGIAAFSLWGLWPLKWGYGPTIVATAGDYVAHPHTEVIRRTINRLRFAVDENQPRYNRKVILLWLSLLALTVETAAAAVSLWLLAG